MFAPLIVKLHARAAVRPSDKSAFRPATAFGHDLDIEQGQTSRRVPQIGPGFLDNESPGVAAWDFSTIPLYPPGPTSGSNRPSPAQIPRLPGPLQRKLKVGAVDDPLEQEADRIADQVMRMPAPAGPAASAPRPISRNAMGVGLGLQRQCTCGGVVSDRAGDCEACSQKIAELQRKPCISEQGNAYERKADRLAGQAEPPSTGDSPLRIQRYVRHGNGHAAPASVERVLAGPGRPLEPALRRDMEQRFGYDFSSVRVHSSTTAEESAREVNAEAYTVGHNVVFGAGTFAPGTNEGRRLLAHELTHVVQQSAGSARINRPSSAGPEGSSDSRPSERAPSNQPYPIDHHSLSRIVQRQMCTDILNAEEVPGVTRGVEVERQLRVDLINQLGPNALPPLPIPGASARLYRMEECGGFEGTQPPGSGIPDLAFRNGRNVELAEVKIGTWPCLWLAEQQVDNYVAVANGDEAYKQALGVDEFELMPTSRFTPSQLSAPDGTPVNVGWCSPGVIVYKAVSSRQTSYCGISDKGRTDELLNRLLDPAEELVAQALRRRLKDLGLDKDLNFKLLLAAVRKRIKEHILWFLRGTIDALCAKGVEITVESVLAELRRQLSLKTVADGFVRRFNHPEEGIDIPVGELAGETAAGLAILGALAELLAKLLVAA